MLLADDASSFVVAGASSSGYVLEAVNLHRFAFFESSLADSTSWTVTATANGGNRDLLVVCR